VTPRKLRDALLDAGWETPPGERHTSLRKGSAFARLDWDGAEEWFWRGDIELPHGGECAVAWSATDQRWHDVPAAGWHTPDTWHELMDIVEAMDRAAQGDTL
jgi:hypothetical protein